MTQLDLDTLLFFDGHQAALPAYRALYTAAAFFGSFLPLDTVFALSDVFNALCAVPNLLAVYAASGRVFSLIRTYKTEKTGENFL